MRLKLFFVTLLLLVVSNSTILICSYKYDCKAVISSFKNGEIELSLFCSNPLPIETPFKVFPEDNKNLDFVVQKRGVLFRIPFGYFWKTQRLSLESYCDGPVDIKIRELTLARGGIHWLI